MGKQQYSTVHCPSVKLNTGAEMPVLGLGTWKSKDGVVGRAVKTALLAGYRHIDCASAYSNEDEVGEALTEVFKEGVVKRSDVFITSKLFNSDHDKVEEACEKTLKDLQVEFLDLYLVHWPITGKNGVPELDPPMTDTWERMEKLQKAGKCKAIGISNFSVKKTKDLLGYAKIKPAVQQIEIHPYWRNEACVEFCQQQGIQITAYSPLGSPDSVATVNRSKDVPVLLEEPALEKISKKVGKDKGQVLLRWGIQRGYIVIPKSANPERIVSNLECLNFELPAEDQKILDTLSFQARLLDGASVASFNPKGPYKNMTELWDGEVSEYNLKMEKLAANEK